MSLMINKNCEYETSNSKTLAGTNDHNLWLFFALYNHDNKVLNFILGLWQLGEHRVKEITLSSRSLKLGEDVVSKMQKS